jgi:hypothetical protein
MKERFNSSYPGEWPLLLRFNRVYIGAACRDAVHENDTQKQAGFGMGHAKYGAHDFVRELKEAGEVRTIVYGTQQLEQLAKTHV